YDGDDRTDAIMQSKNIINISSGCNTSWIPLLNTPYPLKSMLSGGFEDNGITSLFVSNGLEWMVSHESNVDWRPLKASDESMVELKLGFFNGNTISDVIKISGSDIMVSYDGISDWH